MKLKHILALTVGISAFLSNPTMAQNTDEADLEITKSAIAEKKEILSGPFVSYIDGYSTRFWMMVPKGTKEVKIKLQNFDQSRTYTEKYTVGKRGKYQKNRWKRTVSEYLLGDEVPVIIDVQNLNRDEEYNVEIYLDDYLAKEEFNLYMERAHQADVYFLFGGGLMDLKNDQVFAKMQRTSNDFMLWGGDNFGASKHGYDFNGLTKHAKEVRKNPLLNEFMQSTPQIATWGSLDYDKTGFGKDYINKDEAQQAFDLMWPNLPKKVYNYTFENYGTYGKYDYEDVDLFLLDDQTFRNTEKHEYKFGEKQMERLLRDLTASNAKFKVVVANSTFFGNCDENAIGYEKEFTELMRRIHKGNFSGLVFMSMNSHGNTEIIKYERENDYTLTELSMGKLSGTAGNYARIRVEGERKNRKMIMEIYDIHGKIIKTKSLLATQLQN
ncbi:MAG: hypothetical protein N4A45_01985 [Flavobacteriales bacterium]|jgi:hypothetical protein|nr:hypothetical protein [Flavobacteriales bacterium]